MTIAATHVASSSSIWLYYTAMRWRVPLQKRRPRT
jgi:hypothetical protein